MTAPEGILDKIDAILLLNAPFEQRIAVQALLADLDAIPEGNENPEVSFLKGYVWYLHPDRLTSRSIRGKCEQLLLIAIRQDSSNARAWLYLGHNAYDFEDYTLAGERFEKVNVKRLPPYLQLKAQEMELCCKIRRDGLGRSLGELESFVSSAEQQPFEDVWPKELARLLSDEVGRLTRAKRSRFKAVAHRLDATGNFGKWFSELLN